MTSIEQETSTALAVRDADADAQGSIAAFASPRNYEVAKRMATALSQSTIVPDAYRNNVANCLVAMELASRTGASVFMVMQNLHIIKGRPSWAATFLIASVNSCGRFSPLCYESVGVESQAGWKCRASARDLRTGDVLEGEWITWEMVKGEGWLNKDGSKWKTMPGQMIRYRAASFWTRVYAPEISLGMHSADEVEDAITHGHSSSVSNLNAALRQPVVTGDVVDSETGEVLIEATKEPPADPLAGRKCSECGGVDGAHGTGCPFYGD